jgi:hypothetical protein
MAAQADSGAAFFLFLFLPPPDIPEPYHGQRQRQKMPQLLCYIMAKYPPKDARKYQRASW